MNKLVLALVVVGMAAMSGTSRLTTTSERAHHVVAGLDNMPDLPDNLVGGAGNWKKIRAIADKIEWSSDTGRGAVTGTGPGKCATADLTIIPRLDSHKLTAMADNALDNGVIIAKVYNDDANQCDGKGIPLPYHHTAIWIVRYDNTAPPPYDGTSWVVDLDAKWAGITKEAFLPVKAWQTGSCGIKDAPTDGDWTDIKRRKTECSPPPDTSQKQELLAKMKNHRFPAGPSPDDGTLWFDCSLMCCYATAILQ